MPVGPEGRGESPPFPDADLMYVVDLLAGPERERYLRVREFLQDHVRGQS
ncbi:MAG: acyl-CoA dehydrogenase, partial [Arthrobacter sp.]|nr:acyl-CoA dehydrogenase [Arthrobacter sp.]